jgi:hypothetical protein
MSLVKSVQTKGRRQIKEGFLDLETIETWIGYVYHSEGEWAKHLSAFEWGMVLGDRCTRLCQELQCSWVFHAQQFPMCIKNGSPPKGHPGNLTQLWEALLVDMGQYPCGTLSTPCRGHAPKN